MRIVDARIVKDVKTFSQVQIGEVFSTEKIQFAMRIHPYTQADSNAINLETGDKLRYDANTSCSLLNARLVIEDH